MRYVFDIDGTICEPGTTEATRYTGATPIQSRIDRVNSLYDGGHYITYLTARGMGRFKNSTTCAYREFYDFTYNQLKEWGCKFHELHMGKPAGDVYVDDKAANVVDWF
jgi:phosphatidate phosphatase PAH1